MTGMRKRSEHAIQKHKCQSSSYHSVAVTNSSNWVIISAQMCTVNSSIPFVMLKDTLSLPAGDVDEFGSPSDYLSLATIAGKLIQNGAFPAGDTLFAVNLGARDGIGNMGNTDTTSPLFKQFSNFPGHPGSGAQGCR
jgi:hypothetical protein